MWYRTKDIKKFGKGKIPKNRNCHKFGCSESKEYRKTKRKAIKFVKNCLVHNIPFDPLQYRWYINAAKKELNYGDTESIPIMRR